MYVILAGGTGSVKFVRGFGEADVICNVGDNIWLYSLYICPDIDTIMYGLANILHERGWGIKDDTFNFINQLRSYGVDAWFNLGDKDLATHVIRTEMIREGKGLWEVTRVLCKKLGINTKVMPATEDPLETFIVSDRVMHLQEFWVRYNGKPEVKGIIYKGIESARGLDVAIDSIMKAEKVIIAPANPVTSINPIIRISGIDKALRDSKDKCIAISPIIGNKPISGPAAKYMEALGYEVSPYGVAKFYSGFIDSIVIDSSDEVYKRRIEEELKIKVYTTDIIMKDRKDEKRLGEFVKSI